MKRLLLALGLVACRTTSPNEAQSARPPAGKAAVRRTLLPRSAQAPAPLPEDREPPPVLTGFDRMGATSCLPLPSGRACLPHADQLAAACEREQGKTLTCEDCSVICSKQL